MARAGRAAQGARQAEQAGRAAQGARQAAGAGRAEMTPQGAAWERLPLGALVNYNLPAVGVGFMFFFTTLYWMKFSTDVVLIPPVVMGVIFALSRILDAITDPLAGYLSDRTTSPAGRRRPWMLGAIPFIALAFYMMWNPSPSLTPTGSILWMGAGVMLFYTAMTAFNVPHTSLGAELTNSYHERSRIFGFRHAAWTLGALIALVAMHQLIVASDARPVAFTVSAIAIAATAALILWLYFSIRERPDYQGRGERNPFTAFGDIFRNPHAVLLLLAYGIENVGAALVGALTPYIAEYIVGTPELTVFYILAYLIPSAFSVPLWLPVSRRIGKKRLWLIALFTSGLGFGGMFFLQEGSVMLYTLLAVVCGFAAGAGAVMAPSIQADVIDYDEYRSGKRKEGAYFATWNFIYKSATGLVLMLTGFVLSASGFVPNAEQTDATKLALLSLYALFPLLCYSTGALIFTRFAFTEQAHAQIRAALDNLPRRNP